MGIRARVLSLSRADLVAVPLGIQAAEVMRLPVARAVAARAVAASAQVLTWPASLVAALGRPKKVLQAFLNHSSMALADLAAQTVLMPRAAIMAALVVAEGDTKAEARAALAACA